MDFYTQGVGFLTMDAFREWLEAHPDGAVVGKAQDASSCPIARFSNDTLPALLVDMYGNVMIVQDPSVLLNFELPTDPKWWRRPEYEVDKSSVVVAPLWARKFTSLVDMYKECAKPITKEEALATLELC